MARRSAGLPAAGSDSSPAGPVASWRVWRPDRPRGLIGAATAAPEASRRQCQTPAAPPARSGLVGAGVASPSNSGTGGLIGDGRGSRQEQRHRQSRRRWHRLGAAPATRVIGARSAPAETAATAACSRRRCAAAMARARQRQRPGRNSVGDRDPQYLYARQRLGRRSKQDEPRRPGRRLDGVSRPPVEPLSAVPTSAVGAMSLDASRHGRRRLRGFQRLPAGADRRVVPRPAAGRDIGLGAGGATSAPAAR